MPDTHGDWTDRALEEVLARHGDNCPKHLYVDCGCCNGKLNQRAKALLQDVTVDKASAEMLEEHSESVEASKPVARARDKLNKVLDAMHMIARIGRQMNSEHPRHFNFMKKLSRSIYVDSKEDLDQLHKIREKHRLTLTAKELKRDRQRFVRHCVGPPLQTCAHVLALVQLEESLDKEAWEQAAANGWNTSDITVAHPAHPLISKKAKQVVLQQCVHTLNGCVITQFSVCECAVNHQKHTKCAKRALSQLS